MGLFGHTIVPPRFRSPDFAMLVLSHSMLSGIFETKPPLFIQQPTWRTQNTPYLSKACQAQLAWYCLSEVAVDGGSGLPMHEAYSHQPQLRSHQGVIGKVATRL